MLEDYWRDACIVFAIILLLASGISILIARWQRRRNGERFDD